MKCGASTASGEEKALDPNHSPKSNGRAFTQRRVNSLKTQREKLPWPKGQPFRILSLDGGGIKGVYGAVILSRIERELTNGVPIARYFDMIAGTSTGGIMGIGLGLGIPASDIEDLYIKRGKKIFPPWRRRIPLVKYFRTRYDYKALLHELQEAFGDRLFGESETRLVIPAFLGPKSEIAVLKTDHHPDFKRDHAMPAWEVARATSAAPAFFQAHDVVGDEDEPGMFLDGGVWANSPIMAALVDALSAYDVSRDDIRILSIGTGEEPFEITRWQARGGFLQWAEIIKAAIFLTTDNAQSQAALLIGPQRITRLNPEAGCIEMDDWQRAVELLPPAANKDFDKARSEIQSFFHSMRPERERFFSANPTIDGV